MSSTSWLGGSNVGSSQSVQKKPLNAKMYLADNVVSMGTAAKTYPLFVDQPYVHISHVNRSVPALQDEGNEVNYTPYSHKKTQWIIKKKGAVHVASGGP